MGEQMPVARRSSLWRQTISIFAFIFFARCRRRPARDISAIELSKIECQIVADPKCASLFGPGCIGTSAASHLDREGARPSKVGCGWLGHGFQDLNLPEEPGEYLK